MQLGEHETLLSKNISPTPNFCTLIKLFTLMLKHNKNPRHVMSEQMGRVVKILFSFAST